MSADATDNRKLQNRAVLGVVLMITGLALYPLADAFIKHLMGTYSVYQASFLRSLTRLVPLFVTVFFHGGIRKVLGTNHPQRHLVRLAVSLVYTFCFMFAMKQGSLTIVYTLSYTSPFFMIVLSALMLKESVSRERWIAVAIGLVGVIVAMRPGSNLFEAVALVVLLGTFLGALNKILMRRLAETEHSLSIAIYPNVVMILAMLPCMLLFEPWKPMPLEHWGLFAIVGGITAIGQYCIAQALRFTQASILAPVDYSTYFWVVALDLFWWGKSPDAFMIAGAIIIVGSNLYILSRTRKEQAAKKAPIDS
ncbi:MAG TPA: DMT family transporter [Rhabdochlamydiaceae bacterium]|nr:DMT family transporter [Rhabdochlamydiaceae bacterium]